MGQQAIRLQTREPDEDATMALGALKKRYVYTDDAGKNWIIRIAEDRVTGVTPATGLAVYNPASPPTGGIQGVLNSKRCRRVYVQGNAGGGSLPTNIIKRQLICTAASTLYAINASQNVSYTPDGTTTAITMQSTGRRGERITF